MVTNYILEAAVADVHRGKHDCFNSVPDGEGIMNRERGRKEREIMCLSRWAYSKGLLFT